MPYYRKNTLVKRASFTSLVEYGPTEPCFSYMSFEMWRCLTACHRFNVFWVVVEWQKVDRRKLNSSSYYVNLRILTALWIRNKNVYEFSLGNWWQQFSSLPFRERQMLLFFPSLFLWDGSDRPAPCMTAATQEKNNIKISSFLLAVSVRILRIQFI